MAAPRKKPVSKDDIRRLMKEKSSVTKNTSRKVDHPLAKYNGLQQLVCVLCNHVIKNELLWPAHILSKQHKERATALKSEGPPKPDSSSLIQGKRKGQDNLNDNFKDKKRKTDHGQEKSRLPSDFYDESAKPSKEDVKERAKAALLAGYSSSSDDEESGEEGDKNRQSTNPQADSSAPSSSKAQPKGLPSDFFDEGHDPPDKKADSQNQAQHNKKMSDVLPEGFFDDPKIDAKVRKVEYKDKEEAEWELFQKTIKEEAQVSEIIMEEEDEQVNMDRNIDEIDDQIQRWQEVENLHVKKEIIIKTSKSDASKREDSDEDLDEDNLEDFLDWRSKKSVKK